MRFLIKIVLIVIAFFITGGIISMLNVKSDGGFNPIGIILLIGFVAGARAIWKYNPDENNQNHSKSNDDHKLNKS